MKTQAGLRADFQRFMAADMLDEAEAAPDQIESASAVFRAGRAERATKLRL